MAVDHSNMRLGKRPRRDDPRTLKLARYLFPKALAAPLAPPASCDYTRGIKDWGMMLNDQLGCCTIAAVGHAVQVWSANASDEITVPDSTILSYYERWDAYNPDDPSTDQGGVELEVLNDWRQQGFAGHTLDAYAAIDIQNRGHVQAAIWLFGGVYLGVALPLLAQAQEVWDVAGDSADAQAGSWGGHAIYLAAYDEKVLTCITWGQLKRLTWAWFEKYCDEAYAPVSKEWIKSSGIAPSGFDFATLEADLKLVTG
jgi:hypothetical protein